MALSAHPFQSLSVSVAQFPVTSTEQSSWERDREAAALEKNSPEGVGGTPDSC